jgi:hypothetical protein
MMICLQEQRTVTVALHTSSSKDSLSEVSRAAVPMIAVPFMIHSK